MFLALGCGLAPPTQWWLLPVAPVGDPAGLWHCPAEGPSSLGQALMEWGSLAVGGRRCGQLWGAQRLEVGLGRASLLRGPAASGAFSAPPALFSGTSVPRVGGSSPLSFPARLPPTTRGLASERGHSAACLLWGSQLGSVEMGAST